MRKEPGPATASVFITLTLLVAPALADGASRASLTSAKCSRATAQAALRAHPRFDPAYTPKLEFPSQVLCGTFLGAKAQTMIVGFAANVCINDDYNLGWGAYRWSVGSWQPVWKRWEGSQSIAAIGSNIMETRGIRRPNDSGCNDTGGTESRTWHWNGRQFVASAWTRHLAPASVVSRPAIFQGRLLEAYEA